MALLLQALFLPIALSPLAYWLGSRRGINVAGAFSFLVLLYSTLLTLVAASSSPDYLEVYEWSPIGNFGLRLDGISLPFAITIYLLASAMAIYSIPYMKHRIEEELEGLELEEAEKGARVKAGLYFLLYLLYAAGMFGTVLATNLIQFYIFFELMLIPSFFLIAHFGYGDRDRISFMYFIWTHFGALLMLAALLTLGFLAGGFDYSIAAGASIPEGLRPLLVAALVIGLFVKLAAAGLHVWLPHAHAEAPTPISALLSPAMIGIGGYALVRFLIFLWPSLYGTILPSIAIWGVVTMFFGGLMALAQDDLKRLFAYSSISQMGYLIFGIATAYYVGVSGSVFHYVSHGTGKALLFTVAGSVMLHTGGIRSMSRLGGLAGRLPLTAVAAMVGALAIMGIPPMNGFQSEWMIFLGGFAASKAMDIYLPLTILALSSTALTAGYSLLMIRRVFFGPTPAHLQQVKEAHPALLLPLLFLVLVTLILGIQPSLINDRLIPLMKGALGA